MKLGRDGNLRMGEANEQPGVEARKQNKEE
jgi:hypothetical protein